MVTDAEGRFAASGLTPEIHVIHPGESDLPHGYFAWFRVEDSRDLDLGDLNVPIGRAMSGRLVDELGAPLSAVDVFLSYGPSDLWSHAIARIVPELTRWQRGAPDADGSITFSNLAPGAYELFVSSRTHCDAILPVTVPADSDVDLGDVTVAAGAHIHGRVIAAGTGRVVAGARITTNDRLAIRTETALRDTTDEDGRFELRGIRPQNQGIRITAPGYEDWRTETLEFGSAPLVIELTPALTLTGRISGHGSEPPSLRIQWAGRSRPSLAATISGLLDRELEVHADGRFEVTGLPVGPYRVTASAAGIGRSPPQQIEFDARSAPLELTIQPFLTTRVHVRDERGRPIPDARIFEDRRIRRSSTLYRPSEAERLLKRLREVSLGGTPPAATTDAGGTATLRLEQGQPVMLGAVHPDHLSAASVYAADALPDSIELTLSRGGTIIGAITAPDRPRGHHSRIIALRADDDAGPAPGRYASIDRAGQFEIRGVAPGTWTVVLDRSDQVSRVHAAQVGLPTTPLLGAGTVESTRVSVEVRPGEIAEISITDPPTGSIEGQVLHRGRPAPHIPVFAVPAGTDDTPNRLRELPNAPGNRDGWQTCPHVRTDSEGRFRFAVSGVGSWDLRPEHPRAATTAAPTTVHVREPGATDQCALFIPGGSVAGQLDAADLPAPLFGYLVPRSVAGEDPFRFHPRIGSLTRTLRHVDIDAGTGRFGFECVAPGVYFMRIAHRGGDYVTPRWIEIVADESIELGTVAPAAPLALTIRCEFSLDSESSRSRNAHLAIQTQGPRGGLAHVTSLRVVPGQPCELRLDPGQYLAVLERNGEEPPVSAAFEVPAGGIAELLVLNF